MAIVPQRRISKTRKRKRRTHFKIEVPGMMVCPNCGEMKLSHTVCANCGFYDGRQVLTIKEKTKTEEVDEKAAKKTKKEETVPAQVKTTKKATKKVATAESADMKKAPRRPAKTVDKA
jgi:large subunit ribosomal protein L32